MPKQIKGIPKELNDICGATGLNPNKIKTFLGHYSVNNDRYALIYNWVHQGNINYKQMKILIKNIKVKDPSQWLKLNGDWLIVDNSTRKQYSEDYLEC